MPESLTKNKSNIFSFGNKEYSLPTTNYMLDKVERSVIPSFLSRVIPDQPLIFDNNGILTVGYSEPANDLVSLGAEEEWEKFARMYYTNTPFRVLSIERDALIGPTFRIGNRILQQGEILALVPKKSILNEQRYNWTDAGSDYDYGLSNYTDPVSRDFYQRLIINKSIGRKPLRVS